VCISIYKKLASAQDVQVKVDRLTIKDDFKKIERMPSGGRGPKRGGGNARS